ncbi:hypothetical protein KSC_090220 [Ktedonobacter sp. SOSP1-52]|uniref:hypothetical protein n=1 Tax=Ktedonobacter sp. SOSP1-52 TaxID=2778366 RepID=UPI0019150FB0|nr:hypothetical protein [Ktedonobacter sp. SOSP1-52]GHO70130.1 hypothetical protein KSC_090220 [Ktedonobacter sp. SOSP1-52]
MYSLRRNVIRLCIPILSLGLIMGTILLLMHPVEAYAHPSQSQDTLSAFSSSGIKVNYSSNGAFAASGDYTLEATEIIGTNAHMNSLPDPLHPTLTFSASTMTGFSLSHPFYGVNLVLSSNGSVSATGVAIKTGLFQDVNTGLKSFANKADLLILAAGGTVPRLVMKNVTLKVDRSIYANTFTVTSFHMVVSATAPAPLKASPPTDTPSSTVTPSPTKTPPTKGTPLPTGTPSLPLPLPTLTPPSVPTPTPTPKKCPCLLLCLIC